MLKRLSSRGRTFKQLRCAVSNWPVTAGRIAAGRPITQLRVRGGSTISAPPSGDLWNHFNAIWLKECYTQGRELPPEGTVIDIGANVGIFTLLASRRADRVICLEPLPEAYETAVVSTRRTPTKRVRIASAWSPPRVRASRET